MRSTSNAGRARCGQDDDGVARRRLLAHEPCGRAPVLLRVLASRRSRAQRRRRRRRRPGSASLSPRSGIATSPTPAPSATPPAATVRAVRGKTGSAIPATRTASEGECGKTGDERGLPEAFSARGAPVQRDHAPHRECRDDRAPAERAPGPERHVPELERPGAVACIGPVENGRGQEEGAFEHRHADRGHREPQVDLAPRDDERGDLGRKGARGDRMGQRQRHGAQGIDHPPERVAPFDAPSRTGRWRRASQRGRAREGRPSVRARRRRRSRRGSATPPRRRACPRAAVRGDTRRSRPPRRRRPTEAEPRSRRRSRPRPAGAARGTRPVPDRRTTPARRTSAKEPCAAPTAAASSMSSDRWPSATSPSSEREARPEERQRTVEQRREPVPPGDPLTRRGRGVGRSAHPLRAYRDAVETG